MKLIPYLFILVLIPFVGNKSKQEDLKLEILNSEIYSRENLPPNNYRNAWRFDNFIYDSVPINKIRIKITNVGTRKISFVIRKELDKNSDFFKNISLFAYDNNDEIIQDTNPIGIGSLQTIGLDLFDRISKNDSEGRKLEIEKKSKYYKENISEEEIVFQQQHIFQQQHNYVIIYPGEVKYFDYYITLPIFKYYGSDYSVFNLNPAHKYFLRLIFKNDSSYIKKHLSENQLKEIEENGYEIFDGEIRSNKVPIKFIKM